MKPKGKSECPLGDLVGKSRPYNRYVTVETIVTARGFLTNADQLWIIQCPYCHCYHNVTGSQRLVDALVSNDAYELALSETLTDGSRWTMYRKRVPYDEAKCENPHCDICT